jgi:NAD(P)-dependent dehydrogenase (short-subunit alcohol dehydrogenase family)
MMMPTVQQLFDLSGRVAMVTGATGHLGLAMAQALAEAGARVICTSRMTERAETAAQMIPAVATGAHLGISLNHTSETAIESTFRSLLEKTDRVDVLVNNAHEALSDDWTTVNYDQFTQQLANAAGYFHLARLVHHHAVARRAPASIIMLGSMYGVVGSYPEAYEGLCPSSPVAYHALKGSIVQMTRHLSVYWAKDRVRVNCLSPGPFPNPQRVSAELVARLDKKSPMGRMGSPHELKGAVLFLASDASSYMTGQNLVVDGGWTAW